MLEDALKSKDPYKYYAQHLTNTSIDTDTLFKTETATIGQSQLRLIIESIDLNNDAEVTREELYQVFVKYKKRLVNSFGDKLKATLMKLRFISHHAVTFETDEFEYYFGGLD